MPDARELQTELNEANAELRRHHEDFERIQNILERWDDGDIDSHSACKQIRSVVG